MTLKRKIVRHFLSKKKKKWGPQKLIGHIRKKQNTQITIKGTIWERIDSKRDKGKGHREGIEQKKKKKKKKKKKRAQFFKEGKTKGRGMVSSLGVVFFCFCFAPRAEDKQKKSSLFFSSFSPPPSHIQKKFSDKLATQGLCSSLASPTVKRAEYPNWTLHQDSRPWVCNNPPFIWLLSGSGCRAYQM